MTQLALVLAGGGERAVGWESGVLAGLADSGLDPARAGLVLGTSAGSLVGAYAAAGIDPITVLRGPTATRVVAHGAPPATAASAARRHMPAVESSAEQGGPPRDPFIDGLRAWLGASGRGYAEQRRRVGAVALAHTGSEEVEVASAAHQLPPAEWPPALAVVTVDADRGERVVLRHSDGVSLARAVAASRAVPGLRSVVQANGRRLMDGAVGSATNADLAVGAERVVIVTPTPANPPPESLFGLWDVALREELRILRHAGGEVVLVQAGAEDQEAMGPDLMSGARAAQAFAAGQRSGAAALSAGRPAPA